MFCMAPVLKPSHQKIKDTEGGENDMAFNSLRRDFDVEHQLYDAQRDTCGDAHPLAPDKKRNSAEGRSSSSSSEPSTSDASSSASGEEKTRGDGAVLVDPLSDPLSGMLLGGGDFDPLGVMGGGAAPTVAVPSAPLSFEQKPAGSKKPSGPVMPGSVCAKAFASNSGSGIGTWSSTTENTGGTPSCIVITGVARARGSAEGPANESEDEAKESIACVGCLARAWIGSFSVLSD